MKIIRIVMIVFVSAVLLFVFVECSGYGSLGSTQNAETTGGSIDVSPIPANSEFLKE